MTEAVVVGAGPNGLAGAVLLARAGLEVAVYEASATVGGGARTEELIFPGHWHDLCSAVHPMAFASPFFTEFDLKGRLDWIVPEISFGHPLDGRRAGVAYRDLERTVAALGKEGPRYRRIMGPLVARSDAVVDFAMRPPWQLPGTPAAVALIAARTLRYGTPAWGWGTKADSAVSAMLAGVAGHSVGAMPSLAGAAVGLVLGHLAHTVGWPIPVGGSSAITRSLVADLLAHGGRIHTNSPVTSLAQVEGAAITLLDVGPAAFTRLAAGRLPRSYADRLRGFAYGDGVCKVAYILDSPVPWAAPELAGAGTVHVVGTRAEAARAELDVAQGRHPLRPFVLVSQPSTFDSSRAPRGRHILWAYCHVPRGSNVDMTGAISAQLERFAPGFRGAVIASHVTTARGTAAANANNVGGDFGGGATTLAQIISRPVAGTTPWRTPLPGVYLCSSSTSPGPGVHGMGGYHAARTALADAGLARPSLAPDPLAP